jgi:UDP-N-acetylglucosamine 2-epimerase (non-hydrolysing)
LVTGNTVIDALFWVRDLIDSNSEMQGKLAKQFDYLDLSKRLILVTGHRRENFGGALEEICFALRDLSDVEGVEILYPVHLNPNVQEPVRRILKDLPNVYLIDPVEYLSFVYLMMRAHIIVTDSGGIQEEAPSLGKPVLVTRDDTERPEAVEAGISKVVGSERNVLYGEVLNLLRDNDLYHAMIAKENPYGDGLASMRIVGQVTQDLLGTTLKVGTA